MVSRKARVTSLEAVRGTVTSFKIVLSPRDGVYETSHTKAILTKDADGKFFYQDGRPLHPKGVKSRTIVIMRDE